MSVYGLEVAGKVVVALVAFIHVYILILESFLWRGRARKVFRTSEDKAHTTAVMAANQGFYNGLLAAGLIWGLIKDNSAEQTFFLSAVWCAGVFGALTASKSILYVQATPALIGIFFIEFGYKNTDDWSDYRHPVWMLLYIAAGTLATIAFGMFIRIREARENANYKSKAAEPSANSQNLLQQE